MGSSTCPTLCSKKSSGSNMGVIYVPGIFLQTLDIEKFLHGTYTVANDANAVRPSSVASLSHSASTFVYNTMGVTANRAGPSAAAAETRGLALISFQAKSQVMNNVRNLGYVSGKLDVEKVDTSDRTTRGRQSVFDIKSARAGTPAATRQPIRGDVTAGARRPLDSHRSASS